MSKQHKLEKEKSKSQAVLIKKKRTILAGVFSATIICSTPFLFDLHESVPDEKIWNTFLFTYNSNYWEDANVAMWVLTGKLVPLLLLVIWFFTNRHWWYHALLVPICMYTYQSIAILNDDLSYIDEMNIIYLLPVMAIIVPSIYLIRAKMFNKINNADKTLEELEEEFMFKPTTYWGKIKQYF